MTECAIEVSRSLWPFSWFPSNCLHAYPYVCVRPQEDRFKYFWNNKQTQNCKSGSGFWIILYFEIEINCSLKKQPLKALKKYFKNCNFFALLEMALMESSACDARGDVRLLEQLGPNETRTCSAVLWMPSKPEGGKKLERRSDDRLSAGQTHALLRQRTHRTAAIHSVEPSEAHTHTS